MSDTPRPAAAPWAAATWWLVALWLIARVAYLRWACPYELFGDEANFWEWTRHPALSYYSAGPGMLWLLWPWVTWLGAHEWVIRLPAALSTAAAALLLAGLTRDLTAAPGSPGDHRAAFLAAAACLLMPGFHLWSQIMTYDAPYTTLWVAATWVGWRLLRPGATGPARTWALLGFALGAGFLLKYTALILVPGLLGFALLWRRDRRLLPGALLALAALAASALPVILWNARHGWHLLSYLGAHLNAPHSTGHTAAANPLWAPEFIVAQVLLAGLPAAALMVWGAVAAARGRAADPLAWRGMAYALWCGLPPLLFFLAVTPFAHAQANWALPGLAPLLIPAAWLVSRSWSLAPTAVTGPSGRGFQPRPGRAPEASGPLLVRRLWWATVAWGLACAWLVSLPQVTARLPVVGKAVPVQRFSGHSRLARQVEARMAALRRQTGREPFIVASNYDQASLMAFYVSGHPHTFAAASYLGWRQNSYDFWPESDLRSPSLRGRPVVLLGGEERKWRAAFDLRGWQTSLDDPSLFTALSYQGPR